jgi:hypothetical protein
VSRLQVSRQVSIDTLYAVGWYVGGSKSQVSSVKAGLLLYIYKLPYVAIRCHIFLEIKCPPLDTLTLGRKRVVHYYIYYLYYILRRVSLFFEVSKKGFDTCLTLGRFLIKK